MSGFSSTVSGKETSKRQGSEVAVLRGTAENPIKPGDIEDLKQRNRQRFEAATSTHTDAAAVTGYPSFDLENHFVAGFAQKFGTGGKPMTYIGYGTYDQADEDGRQTSGNSVNSSEESASENSAASVHAELDAVVRSFEETTAVSKDNQNVSIQSEGDVEPDVGDNWHQYNKIISSTYCKLGKNQLQGNLYRLEDDHDSEPNQNLWGSIFSHNAYYDDCSGCVSGHYTSSMEAEHRWGNHHANPSQDGLSGYYPNNPKNGSYSNEFTLSLTGTGGPSASVTFDYDQQDVEVTPSSENNNAVWEFSTNHAESNRDLLVNLGSQCWILDDISDLNEKPAVGSAYNKSTWQELPGYTTSAETEVVYKHELE
ncbi:hypothetical protein [Haloferax elongans]|uniref:hypothetical protein n=1 Tax=Haloferax elongans TaxID=403191 RepID=UPI000A96E27F|nr:hypothetical protein [Haloferax elongans]